MSVEKIIASIPTRTQAQRRQMRLNAEDLLHLGSPLQQADAAKMTAALDAFEADLSAEEHRKQAAALSANIDKAQGLERPERVAFALGLEPPSDARAKAIRALLDRPGSTSAELSDACGWSGNAWHLVFGTMCRKLEPLLWPAEPFSAHEGKMFYSGILADFAPETSRFTMRPEAAAGLASAGFKAKAGA